MQHTVGSTNRPAAANGILVAMSCLFLALLVPVSSVVATGPENVLVIVNLGSEDSVTVANHFIQLRQIPACNVVYLKRIPAGRRCGLKQFKELILLPIVETIKERGLGAQIDCIAYSTGFPTAVNAQDHLEILKQHVTDFDARIFRPICSLNALTFYYAEVMADNPGYLSLESNWYMRREAPDMLTNAFVGPLQKQFESALGKYESADYTAAISQLSPIVQRHAAQYCARYQLVRALAADGQLTAAIDQLKKCVATGWCYQTFTKNDKRLTALHNHEQFDTIVQSIPDFEFGQMPSRGFSNQILWARNGAANGQLDQGRRFVLSTVLAMTGEKGSTVDQAIKQLERSAAADATFPAGNFYFAKTSDVRSKTRQSQFESAIAELRKLGLEGRQVRSAVPDSQDTVAGATLGKAKIDWAGSGSQFAPGALCDNLTSYGGIIPGQHSQTRLTDFLNAGAAGASGTVVEPYSIPHKFPTASLHTHYARGCTLAEAFYQSVHGPFQLLIVGDPLCKPFAVLPEFTISGLEDEATCTSNPIAVVTATETSPRMSHVEVFVDGRKVSVSAFQTRGEQEPGTQLEIDISNLSDGYHEIRIVGFVADLISTSQSKSFGIFVNKNGHSVGLNVAGPGTYQLNRTLSLTAKANCGESIEIYQNLRLVGKIDGQQGELRFDCKELGRGPTTLQAVVVGKDERVLQSSGNLDH